MIYLLRFVNIILFLTWVVILLLEVPFLLVEYIILGKTQVVADLIIDATLFIDDKIERYENKTN